MPGREVATSADGLDVPPLLLLGVEVLQHVAVLLEPIARVGLEVDAVVLDVSRRHLPSLVQRHAAERGVAGLRGVGHDVGEGA